jgi:regulatory protein
VSSKRKTGRPKPTAYDKAVDLLARRQQTVAELSRKLRQRGYDGGEVEEALDRLIELNYLDDERTAADWAEEMARSGGRGRRRAVEKMIQRGIPYDVAKAQLDAVWDDELEREHARRALQKLLRSSSIPSHGPRRNAKLYRSLVNRGFAPEIVRELLDTHRQQEDQGDQPEG